MKVIHLTSVHVAGDTRIFHKMCRTLARAGCDVVLVAVSDADAVIDGVRLRAVPRPRSRRERMTATAWNVLRAAIREGNAIAHIHDPELIPVGVILRALGWRVVYDAHEDIAVNFRTKAWIPRPLRAATAFAGDAVTRAAGFIFSAIVAATPTIASRFPADRTTVIHNYPVLEDYARTAEPRTPSRRIAYCGEIARDRGVLEMIRAMNSDFMPDDVTLVLAGRVDGDDLRAEMRRLPGWSRVEELGVLRSDEVPALLSTVAVALAPLHPTQAFLDSLPTKLYEYAAAGAPIVCSDFPQWRSIVGESGARFVDPLDPDMIARAVADLLADPQEAAAMAERARSIVREKFSWEREGARLLVLYDRLRPRTAVPVRQHL